MLPKRAPHKYQRHDAQREYRDDSCAIQSAEGTCAHTHLPCVHLSIIKSSVRYTGLIIFDEDVELLIESEAQRTLSTPSKCWFSYI